MLTRLKLIKRPSDPSMDAKPQLLSRRPKRQPDRRGFSPSIASAWKVGSPFLLQVAFEDAADEVDVEEDGGPKRSAHGRKATAFVPKSRASPGVTARAFGFLCGVRWRTALFS